MCVVLPVVRPVQPDLKRVAFRRFSQGVGNDCAAGIIPVVIQTVGNGIGVLNGSACSSVFRILDIHVQCPVLLDGGTIPVKFDDPVIPASVLCRLLDRVKARAPASSLHLQGLYFGPVLAFTCLFLELGTDAFRICTGPIFDLLLPFLADRKCLFDQGVTECDSGPGIIFTDPVGNIPVCHPDIDTAIPHGIEFRLGIFPVFIIPVVNHFILSVQCTDPVDRVLISVL